MCRQESPDVIACQRTVIEDLARSNDNYVRQFEQMKLSIDINPSAGDVEHRYRTPALFTQPSRPESIGNGPFIHASFNPTQAPSQLEDPACSEQQFEKPSIDVLRLALTHYHNLMGTVLQQVYSPAYQIPSASRNNIKNDVWGTHMREINRTEAKLNSLFQSQQQKPIPQRILGATPRALPTNNSGSSLADPQLRSSRNRKRKKTEDPGKVPGALCLHDTVNFNPLTQKTPAKTYVESSPPSRQLQRPEIDNDVLTSPERHILPKKAQNTLMPTSSGHHSRMRAGSDPYISHPQTTSNSSNASPFARSGRSSTSSMPFLNFSSDQQRPEDTTKEAKQLQNAMQCPRPNFTTAPRTASLDPSMYFETLQPTTGFSGQAGLADVVKQSESASGGRGGTDMWEFPRQKYPTRLNTVSEGDEKSITNLASERQNPTQPAFSEDDRYLRRQDRTFSSKHDMMSVPCSVATPVDTFKNALGSNRPLSQKVLQPSIEDRHAVEAGLESALNEYAQSNQQAFHRATVQPMAMQQHAANQPVFTPGQPDTRGLPIPQGMTAQETWQRQQQQHNARAARAYLQQRSTQSLECQWQIPQIQPHYSVVRQRPQTVRNLEADESCSSDERRELNIVDQLLDLWTIPSQVEALK